MDTGADDRALPALLPARREGAAGEGRLERGRAAGPAAAAPGASGCGSRCAPPGRCWRSPCSSRVFLPLRGIDLVAARLAGRPVTAARAGGSCGSGRRRRCRRSGLRFVQRGAPMRGRRRLRRQPFELDRHRGAAARRGAVPRLQGRGARLAGDRAHRPRDRHHVHRPPPGRGQAAGGGAPRAARAAATRWRSFPRAPAPTAQRVLPFKSALFGVFFAPGAAGAASRCSR